MMSEKLYLVVLLTFAIAITRFLPDIDGKKQDH